MQQNGLRVESRSGNFHLDRVDATDDATNVDPGDLIFFAVKNYDVEKAVLEMAGLAGSEPRS